MSTFAWVIVNAVLLGSAIVSVKLACELPDTIKAEQQKIEAAKEKSTKKEKPAPSKAARTTATAKNEPSVPQIQRHTLDDIWKKSLFTPDRTENPPSDTVATQQQPEQEIVNADLELTGIAQIGDNPIAIIRQKVQTRPSRNVRLPGRTRPGMPPPPTRTQQLQDQDSKEPIKKIFRVGDVINKTGYVVKSIEPSERKVVITRNGKDEILTSEFGDSQSSSRKQEALTYQKEVQARAATRIKATTTEAKPADTPQQGTPPPAAPGQPRQREVRMPPTPPGMGTGAPGQPPPAPPERPDQQAQPGTPPTMPSGRTGSQPQGTPPQIPTRRIRPHRPDSTAR